MINEDELLKVGKVIKCNGFNGDVRIEFTSVIDEDNTRFLIAKEEGLLTPFYVEGYKWTSDTGAMYKLEGIDDEKTAKKLLIGKDIYVEKENVIDDRPLQDNDDTLLKFIGYKVTDTTAGLDGKIKDIDMNTANVLLIVETAERGDIMIPLAQEYIASIDDCTKTISLNLPEGLMEL